MTDQRFVPDSNESSHPNGGVSSGGEHFSLAPDDDYTAVRKRLAKFDVEFDVNWSGGKPAAVRLARFPDIDISLAQTPQLDVEWARDDVAAHQATILIARVGGIRIEPDIRSVSYGTRAVLILPGPERVRMHTTDPSNEYISAAFPVTLLPSGAAQLESSIMASGISWPRLAPLYNFIATTASASISVEGDENMALFSVVREVLSTLATLLLEGVSTAPTLYDRATTHLRRHFSDSNTNVDSLADALGVTPRKVQAALAENGTTVTLMLRGLRTAEAQRVRTELPELSPDKVAEMTGFSSLSTMYRALRSESAE